MCVCVCGMKCYSLPVAVSHYFTCPGVWCLVLLPVWWIIDYLFCSDGNHKEIEPCCFLQGNRAESIFVDK